MPKILIVEDDQDLTFLVDEWLTSEGYALDICHNGLEGYEYARQGTHDIIILDWDLPGMTGVEICRKYRQNGGTAPILMLTGKSRIDDKEMGLDSGADDYLSKPFHMRELSARLRALARRPSTPVSSTLKVGHLEMDFVSHKFFKGGVEVHLTPKEFALLELLMRRPGEMFSTEAILQRVWSFDSEASSDAVRTSVRRIRQKLDDSDDESQSVIESSRKIGYRLRVPQ
ncbi:MAG: response regulator transcription factor [Cyanobacteria bacterium SZAS TMP-1]|nr:response regulator transcription factor [Cyanobacteria bacterium SZAS TMP-1]